MRFRFRVARQTEWEKYFLVDLVADFWGVVVLSIVFSMFPSGLNSQGPVKLCASKASVRGGEGGLELAGVSHN